MDKTIRYKITIEYAGTNFSGWQRQVNVLSVQQLIESAIYEFSLEKVMIQGAGRTDAGVHAIAQVAHFDLSKEFEPRKIATAINHFLRPHLISIIDCIRVSDEFHARFSAKRRHYLYRIINRPSPIAIEYNKAWWIKEPLDIESMREAAGYLIGNHDFTSFRASYCQSISPVKTLSTIKIVDQLPEIRLYISAPSFLHHMVRNIVGSLVLVGMKRWQPERIRVALEKRNRVAAGPTAPADGLYFIGVEY